MLTLLNPRLLAAAIVLAALLASHFIAYRKGIVHERTIYAAAQAAANEQARETEQLRQRARDVAVDAAATREVRLRADADRARAAAGGLRDAVAASEQASRESAASAEHAVRTLGVVVNECSAQLGEVAAAADRATSEAVTLREAWPR